MSKRAPFRSALPQIPAENQNTPPVVGYPPTFQDPFSRAVPGDQPGLGSFNSVTAPATAQGVFGNEMYQWSANVPEASEHARHVDDNWKEDAGTSAKAVLMFVSLQLLVQC